ncbi:MAG: hypothetical protein VX278_13060, partial [Myxococcota bacterium]|nr:hypothetical protein [Myxococcota bacterium]
MSDDKIFDQVMEGLRQLSPDERKKAFTTIKRERQAAIQKEQEKAKDLPNAHFSKAHILKRISNP